jgi:thiol-disulfide isomerase/thioredoxin
MKRGPVGLVVMLAAVLLAGCTSSHTPSDVAPGPSKVDVGSADLIAYKKHTDVPDCPKARAGKVDGGMPAVTLQCLGGGRAVDVASLRGPMIVNFWASWCTDCRTEMPALAAYARNHPAVKVVGIDYVDTQPAAALQLARASNVGYPLLADPGGSLDRAAPLPHIQGLPFTAFVDASGRVVHREFGALTTQPDVARAAHDYLGAAG